MDQATIQLAQALAGTPANIEYFYDNSWHAAAPPAGKVRDGLGTTHHEAGTLWIGTDPASSVVNLDGQFHHIQNAYVAGPAVFPALGSANPSLTAFTLARRTAQAIAQKAAPAAAPGTLSLLNATLQGWQMAGSGRFNVVGSNTVESEGGIGLLWYTKEEFSDFLLTVPVAIYQSLRQLWRVPSLPGARKPKPSGGLETRGRQGLRSPNRRPGI